MYLKEVRIPLIIELGDGERVHNTTNKRGTGKGTY